MMKRDNHPVDTGKGKKRLALLAIFAVGYWWYWSVVSTASQKLTNVVPGGGSSTASRLASQVEDLRYWIDVWWIAQIKGTSLKLGDDGMLVFPPKISRVWIDVGVHGKSDFIDLLTEQPDLYLLGFEPALDLYKPCDHERCAVFWAACTPTAKMVELNIQGVGGLCNSLLKPNSNTSAPLGEPSRGCVEQQKDEKGQPKKYKVPGMPLSYVLARIPSNIQVEYIKIDAQGFDLEVMKGALLRLPDGVMPSHQERHQLPQVVSLEAIDVQDRSALLYHGQPTLGDIMTFMQRDGWISVFNSTNNGGRIHEVNAYFALNNSYVSKVDSLPKK